ncbi:MXAN_6640 family putative metalloprotease [Nocardioides houyundeii]|uniref:MXAN_6640 family putative metalloprotease n=1 Tax=Nocardioides houyundeii TaxID=2045452 RepID=UPI000DF193E3|nr:MXAN_6640 family putative metalloprotease [Nocardioides houyundeii]
MPRLAAVALATGLTLALLSPGTAFADEAEPAPPAPAAPELQLAQDVLGGETTEAVDGDERDATMVLRDLWLARPTMSAAERRSADALLARPTIPGKDAYVSYQPDTPTSTECSQRICVTYVTTTQDRSTPAWAAQVLSTMESAWTREVDELGYRAPAPDGDAGGDSRFDVYLADVSNQGLYGYCAPESAVPGEPARAQAYCVLDNDMAGFAKGPLASLRVTAAHEFFHAIQFNIDSREDQWFMEASATWMEEQVAGEINDNRQFLKSGQLGTPSQPLDTYSTDLSMYGNWIFVQRLAQSFGVDAVRSVWQRLDASVGKRNLWSLRGVRSYLRSQGATWPKFYSQFAESNLTPRRSYEEGKTYRATKVARRLFLSAKRPRASLNPGLRHLTSHTVRIKAARSLPRRTRLVVNVKAKRGGAADPVARLLVYKKSGKLSRVNIKLDRKGRGQQRVSLDRRKVRKVELVLSNASLRYRDCGSGTAWACGGRPRDDDQRFHVVVRAVR